MTSRTEALPEIISEEILPCDIAPPKIGRLVGVSLNEGVSMEIRVMLERESSGALPLWINIESTDAKKGSCAVNIDTCLPATLIKPRQVTLDLRYLLDCTLTEDGLLEAITGALEAFIQPLTEVSIIRFGDNDLEFTIIIGNDEFIGTAHVQLAAVEEFISKIPFDHPMDSQLR